MNVLLFALGSHGDVHPFVGIGIRLKQRGHHVAIAANGYFKTLIDHAGLEFIELGTAEEYRALAVNRDLWHPQRGPRAVFQGTARYLRPMFDIACAFAERGDVVIVASSLALGARVAQDKFNIRLATIHLSPSIFQSAYVPPQLPFLEHVPSWAPPPVWKIIWRIANHLADGMIAPPLNALRRDVGLPPVRNILRDYWHSPQRVIGLFPAWFAPKQIDWPRQTVLTGFPLFDEPDLSPISSELEQFLRSGEPPSRSRPALQCGKASASSKPPPTPAPNFIAADFCSPGTSITCRQKLPSGVIHVHYAPFSTLLPRCCAFVHHTGIGTSAQAMASGVPQLATPFTHDQPDNTARLVKLGIAGTLRPAQYTPDRAARLLHELIKSPRIAANCRSVAARFVGVDALGDTCDQIELLANRTAIPAI